jgi:cbb3-type cytochrome oxidase maturation protein
MDILFLLIPLSVVLVFLIMAVFAWAIQSGQFDDLEREGERILAADPVPVDRDQAARPQAQEK